MDSLVAKLEAAQKLAMANRPKVGGFPFLAETLRHAGVKKNTWTLPACESVYTMEGGAIVQLGTPLVVGTTQIPQFAEEALIRAIRSDQAGESTFPEFLQCAWDAGVVWYEVDFEQRTVVYGGAAGETYRESYPQVTLEA